MFHMEFYHLAADAERLGIGHPGFSQKGECRVVLSFELQQDAVTNGSYFANVPQVPDFRFHLAVAIGDFIRPGRQFGLPE